MRRHTAAILVGVLAAVACRSSSLAADGGDAPGVELLEDEWALVKINDQPAGYAHIRVVRQTPQDGRVRITTSADERVAISRMGVTITVEEKAEFTEFETGEPIGFSSNQLASKQRKVTAGRVLGNELELTITVMGRTRKTSVKWDPENVFPYAIERESKKLTAAGQKFSVKTYLPEMGQITLRAEAKGRETIDVGGKRVELFRVDISGAVPGVTVSEYRDSEGRVVKSVTPIAGMKLTTERCDRETALRLGSAAAGVDLMTETFVRPKVSLPHPKRVEGCTYRLTFHSGRLEEVDLGADERQEILKRELVGGKLVIDLRVRALGPDLKAKGKLPGKKYLASTSTLQADDPEIVRFARRVTEEIEAPYAKAKALERWVNRSINKKGFDVGFASAQETMRTRAGDCTEHAVLLAAMLRAVAIPSKTAAGLVNFKGIFGYHMWTECFVGRWVALDATLASPFVDATHIEFSDSDLGEESPLKSFNAVIGQVTGKIDMEILDFTVDGKTVKIADLGEIHAFDPEVCLYTDKLNGFSFQLPEGWKFVPKADRHKSLTFASAVFVEEGGSGRIKVEVIATPYEFNFAHLPLILATKYAVDARRGMQMGNRRALLASYRERRGPQRYNGLFILDGDVLITIAGQNLGPGGAQAFEGIAGSLDFLPPVWERAGGDAGDAGEAGEAGRE